ncbi:MAG: hypothetical protein H5T83_10490, partial [Actinotalea sp.]|nr:hypothetical protein [Actinotalea sp.]
MSSSVEPRVTPAAPERPATATRRGPTDVPARLRPPVLTPTEIPRERLLRALAAPTPVTVVCGPAGSGKTSLVAGWVAREGLPVAWVSLDRHDDDPGRFWTGVLAALRGTGLFPPQARLHELVAPVGAVAPAFVETVVDAVAEQADRLVLVLDDVHVLRDDAAVDSLRVLVHRLPDCLRLVLVSRSEPPIGLPRLRLRGLVTDVGAGDLAFTVQESAELAARKGLDLPGDALRALQDRAEGWVAGITIAVMALTGGEDPRAFVTRFSGDDHAVADYLISEVLDTLPGDVRRFLQRTSICAEVNPGLAQRLTDRADAGAVLEQLVRDNTFTRRLGREGTTYRYHELLRTFLTADLRRHDPDAERALHRVAASWFAHLEPLHAMEHLAQAGELEELAELAGTQGMAAIVAGRSRWLAEVLDAVDGGGRTQPVLALLGAAAQMELDDLDAADRWLIGLDLYALYHRGVTRLFVGRYAESIDDLSRAAEIARVTGRDAAAVACLSFLAGSLASDGSLLAMRRPAEDALALAERRGWARSPAVAHAHLLVGWSDYLLGDTAAAREAARVAVASLGRNNDPDVELAVLSLDVVVEGEGPRAYEAMRDYRSAFGRLRDAQMSPALLAYAVPLVVRVCLRIAERTWARELVQAVDLRPPGAGETALLRAMLHHDAGSTDAARSELAAIERGQAPCHV